MNPALFAGLALSASVVLVASAQAADMPVFTEPPAPLAPPPPVVHDWWTGPYIGAHVGYGWGDHDITPVPTGGAALGTDVLVPMSIDSKGFLGGVQAGYNGRWDSLIVGLEGDISWAGIDGDTYLRLNPDLATFASAHIDWLATLRGGIGFLATEELLIYATGGLAAGRVRYSWGFDIIPNGAMLAYYGSTKSTEWGWTVGGGLEWALDENWSVLGEYRYYDLGSTSFFAPGVPQFEGAFHVKADTRLHTVRLGVNYRFSHPSAVEPVIAKY